MKKSFAENCIRYISTATALILALAMLCCANFSAGAKNLGSNLTISDSTLLLQDINTTTNTTPAKTKDLIASGANIDLLSTGFSGTIYVNASALNLSTVYIHYWGGPNSTTYPGIQMTSLGNGIFSYEIPSSDNPTNCLFHDNATNNKIQTADLTISDNYCTLASDKTATWSTYSGGSDTPTGDLTIYYKNTNNWSTVNIYCWQNSNENNKNKAWPGKSMTKVEGTDDIYSYTISTSSNWDRCIFSDGSNSGNKTTDLTIPSNGKNYYNGSSWSSLYTVTFNNNGYGATPNRQYIASGSTATDPGTLTAEGQTFGGWYTDSACTNKYNFSTEVTGNITLYAKWSAISTEDITVYFDNSVTQWENVYVFYWNKESLTDIYDSSGKALKGNGTEVKYKTISNVTSQLLSVAVPYNTTYIAFTSFKGNATQNMDTYDNFYGTGEKEFIACYYTNSSDNKFTLDNNTHKFSSSKTVFTPSGNTASNTYNSTKYINGTWSEYTVPKHTVTFDNKGHGGTTESQLVTDGQCATEPTKAPTASGYTFGGWYTDENCTEVSKYNFNTHVTGNITLYAKWTANEYTVTFDYKDGTTTPTTTVVTYNEAYGTLPAPTRTGYTFNGWYLEEEFNNEVTSTITVTTADNHTLYAKWTAKEYNITYMSDGSQLSDLTPTNYTYGVGVTTLPTNVTKDGYTFKGWYDNEGLTGDAVTSISQEATGDKTFYAKWELNTFKHKYVFLDTTNKGWIFSGGCKVYVSFDDGNSYTKMNELFTNDSGYDTTNGSSKLLFAKVPDNTTKFIFRRQNTSGNHNETPYLYSNFKNNNLLTLQDDQSGGNNNIDGTWSTVNYTPVPIKFTVGENGKVYLINTKNVDMPVAIGTSTIYADKSATSLKVKVTPNTGYEVNVLKVNDVEKSVYISDKSAGGTVDVGTLGDTNTVEVTFRASQSPKIKVLPVANSSIKLLYTDPDGISKIGTAFDTEYEIQYNSSFTLEITPASGYYVKRVSDNLTPTETLPKAGTITATASQIKTDLTVSYELAENPTVTIECYDSSGNKLSEDSGVGITVDDGTEVLATQTKSVSYKSDIQTGAKFTASVNDITKYRFLGFYDASSASGTKYVTGRYVDYSVSVTDDSITTYDVESNITIYAIFSKQYRVTFKYKNLTAFTVNGTEYANESYDYFAEGTMLSLEAAITDDYKLTTECWTISPENGVTFTPNGTKASYLVGTSDVTITITPKIATYTGQGKWGSKTLRIDTSSVGASKAGYDPWFAVAFKKSSTDTDNYFIRCSKVSDGLYECVIPDGYTHFDVYRMATGATAFTTSVESSGDNNASTIAWNKTHQVDADNRVVPVEIGSNTSYKLSYNGTVGQMSIATK